MSPAEEVKSRLDIIDVIREYVPLKPAGANWRACCPFHNEKTPSFMVSKPKQMWHCFGCGEGGDVFTFVMKQEGLEFPDALRLLAEKAGVRLRQERPEERTERQRLSVLLEATVTFWSKVLWEEPLAREARRYLQDERHFLPETIRDWRLGYAQDSWDALVNHLAALGFNDDEMTKAGVAIRKMEMHGRSVYDRFRNRIMFPIADAHGRIVGTTGRILDTASMKVPAEGWSVSGGKYVNTPETLLYRKGSVLYGLDKAKAEIRRQNLAVLVEGNMDVIASHQAGVTNVVAASGTALTMSQVETIKRYAEGVAFCFDADPAGETATLRGLTVALSAIPKVAIIQLPKRPDGQTYKDPDECVRENPEAWRAAIISAEPVMEYYFRRAVEDRDLSRLEDKQQVTKTLLGLISELPDSVAVAHYLQKLASLVQVPERYLREALPRRAEPSRLAAGAALTPPPRRDGQLVQSERLLAALLRRPEQAGYVISAVVPEMLASELRELYRAMVVHYTENSAVAPVDWLNPAFSSRLKEAELSTPSSISLTDQLAVLSLLSDKEFAEVGPLEVERDLIGSIKRLKKAYLKQQLRELEQSLRVSESSSPLDPERQRVLLNDLQTLSRELRELDSII